MPHQNRCVAPSPVGTGQHGDPVATAAACFAGRKHQIAGRSTKGAQCCGDFQGSPVFTCSHAMRPRGRNSAPAFNKRLPIRRSPSCGSTPRSVDNATANASVSVFTLFVSSGFFATRSWHQRVPCRRIQPTRTGMEPTRDEVVISRSCCGITTTRSGSTPR